MPKPYQGFSAPLERAGAVAAPVLRALREDLRALGYLHSGITGTWTDQLDDAVQAIRLDLTHAKAPAVVKAYNAAGKVLAQPVDHGVTAVEPALATIIAQMAADPAFVKLPRSDDPAAANKAAVDRVKTIFNGIAPTPFLLAMFRQESASRHFYVPTASNADAYVVTGLDRNDKTAPKRITSRGYGLGQYTIFHHPPTKVERDSFILDPKQNVSTAYAELREKMDKFVINQADDRMAEFPLSPLRLCKYDKSDARYMKDCRACAAAAPKRTINTGDSLYAGSATKFGPSQYYADTSYTNVPDRRKLGCDWPYAARRYNGSGINSFHYQFRILKNLLLV